jgi:hypothetical protein
MKRIVSIFSEFFGKIFQFQSTERRDEMGGPLSPPYSGPYDIPVLIDDVKQYEGFEMTRLSYFIIEATTAVDDWVAILRERKIPFLLFGPSAVIHRPNLDSVRFRAPDEIDLLFDEIESVEGLVVETAHIWLPNYLFETDRQWKPRSIDEDSTARRGTIYRIAFNLFQKALQFQREVISAGNFSEQCQAFMSAGDTVVAHSAEETRVFQKWSVDQFELARQNYVEQRSDPTRGVLPHLDKTGRQIAG